MQIITTAKKNFVFLMKQIICKYPLQKKLIIVIIQKSCSIHNDFKWHWAYKKLQIKNMINLYTNLGFYFELIGFKI